MTGGGTFIGSHLLARLLAAGMDVTLMGATVGESRYTASVLNAGEVRFLRCDGAFRQEGVLRRAMEGVDTLLLLDYVVPESNARGARLLEEIESNVAPLIRLLRAADGPVRHVVFSSSMDVYGQGAARAVLEADAPWPETAYAIAKLASEEAVRSFARSAGWTASILRYSTVYGAGETASGAIPNLIRAALADRSALIEADGRDEGDYLHVCDAAEAALAAVRRHANGTYNIGTGTATTTIELAELVFRLAGARVKPTIRAPRGSDARHPRLVPDPGLARAELAFTARRALDEGLAEEIGWFRSLRAQASTDAASMPGTVRATVSLGASA